MKLLALSIIAALLLIAPSFAWAESSLFSGFELFAGIGARGATEQKIHLSRHRSSVKIRSVSEISFRTDLQKS